MVNVYDISFISVLASTWLWMLTLNGSWCFIFEFHSKRLNKIVLITVISALNFIRLMLVILHVKCRVAIRHLPYFVRIWVYLSTLCLLIFEILISLNDGLMLFLIHIDHLKLFDGELCIWRIIMSSIHEGIIVSM